MILPQDALDEFKAIYRKRFGEDIPDDDAQEMGSRLLHLYDLLTRPPRRDESLNPPAPATEDVRDLGLKPLWQPETSPDPMPQIPLDLRGLREELRGLQARLDSLLGPNPPGDSSDHRAL